MKDERLIKDVAEWRIWRLFSLAELNTKPDGSASVTLAKRYIGIARSISSHYKARIPKTMMDRICKNCNSVLIPGVNCTVRLKSGSMIYKCGCGTDKKVFVSSPYAKPV